MVRVCMCMRACDYVRARVSCVCRYPEAQAVLDYNALDLKPFYAGKPQIALLQCMVREGCVRLVQF